MAKLPTPLGAIGYEEAGRSSGVPIVFLHGVGSDKSVWRRQLDRFGRSHRAIAFDYPGYGESDFVPDATRDDFAAAMLAAMDQLEVEQAHLCGLSLGGVIAIAMHHAAPSRCRSLTLADTFAVHPDGRGIYDRSVDGSADMPAFAEARADFLLAQPADPQLRAEVVATMSRIDSEAYRLAAAAVWLADQRERVQRIAVPTLVLCGEEDQPTAPALSRDLHALIAGSRLQMIAAAGHLTNIEQPGAFNAHVYDLITSTD